MKEKGTGLEFEIGDAMGEQMTFDTEQSVPSLSFDSVEIDLSGAEKRSDEEFFVPDSFEIDEKYSSESFIDDPMQLAPTYMPRFTEASDNYRMYGSTRGASSVRGGTAKPAVDPTSEADESKAVSHVVVAPAAAPVRDTRDESITILKFDEAEDTAPVDEEAEAVRELTDVVIGAAYLDMNDAPEPEAVECESGIPEEPEEPAPAEVSEVSAELPDPFAGLDLVDYDARDTDPESLSAEEAPIESGMYSGHGEFKNPAEQDSIKDRFLDHLMSVKIRLFGALTLFALMLAIDVLSLFSVDVLSIIGIGHIPFASAVVDLQLSACIALFALPELVRAVKNLFKRVFSPELVIIVSLLLISIHTLAVTVSSAVDYPVFGLLLGIQVLSAILASYYRISADFTSFKIISKNTVKSIMDKRFTRSLPRENLALDGAVDEYKSKIARMFRTAFISDFFARASRAVENSSNNVIMLLVSLGVSIITAIISWLLHGSLTDFTGSLAFVFLVSFPAFVMLVHKLPHYRSSVETKNEEGAFVGESSIYACSDVDVIAFDDVEIFGEDAVSIKKMHLYGKAYNASKAMEEMYALFAAVGGPLRDLFAESLDGKGLAAADITIEDDGISGTVYGRTVLAGTLDYMKRHGATVPDDDYRTNVAANDSTKVMYGAEDGEVYVKFFIRYSFSEEFTMLLPGLKRAGIVPLIYTRDPNLTADFFKMLTLGEDIIRVMKKYTLPFEEEKIYRRVSAGIVTLGGKLNAINVLLLAKKYTAFQSGMSASELIAMVSGAVVSVLFALTASLGIPMVAIAALQLVWTGYLYIRTYSTFKDKRNKGKQ